MIWELKFGFLFRRKSVDSSPVVIVFYCTGQFPLKIVKLVLSNCAVWMKYLSVLRLGCFLIA